MDVKKILVPTDLSPTSLAALEAAKFLARRFRSEIVLVCAFQSPVFSGDVAGAAAATQIAIEQERAVEIGLQRLERRLKRSGFKCRSYTREGSPAEVIVNLAKRLRVSLIAIATHGSGGLARMLLGSVTDRVVRSAPCPVLTVRPPPRRSRRTKRAA